MNFALIYLIHRFFYRIFAFFYNWYIGAFYYFAHSCISFLERLDRVFAIRVTARHFFEPLYKDYTMIGRILGIIFRSIRIIIAAVVYIFVVVVFVFVYAAWILVPILIMLYAGEKV